MQLEIPEGLYALASQRLAAEMKLKRSLGINVPPLNQSEYSARILDDIVLIATLGIAMDLERMQAKS